jgi:hypothetical protein
MTLAPRRLSGLDAVPVAVVTPVSRPIEQQRAAVRSGRGAGVDGYGFTIALAEPLVPLLEFLGGAARRTRSRWPW